MRSYLKSLFESPLDPKFDAHLEPNFDTHYHSIVMNVGYTNCKMQFRIDVEKTQIVNGVKLLKNMCQSLQELYDGTRTYVEYSGNASFLFRPSFEIQCTYGEYILRNNRNTMNRSEEGFEIRSTNIVEQMILNLKNITIELQNLI
jgi:hypothetical protein